MRRFTFLANALLTITVLTGCGRETSEKPADSLPEPEKPAIQPAESEQSEADLQTSKPSTPANPLEQLNAALKAKNPGFGGKIALQPMGPNTLAAELRDPTITDISPLAGLPIAALDLAGCHLRWLTGDNRWTDYLRLSSR